MKKQSLSISVPEPCHENWSQMTPVEKGRHCASCRKTVIDFTRMPKSKIAEYIKNSKGSTCGRFTSDQLNVELVTPKPSKSWLKYAAIFLGLIPFASYGQNSKSIPVQTHRDMDSIKGEFAKVNVPIKGKIVPSKFAKIQTFEGTIFDKDSGEPILFGSLVAYNSSGKLITGVETDLEGRFKLADVVDAEYLEASYIGYEQKRVYVKDLKSYADIRIELKEGFLTGDAIVVVGLMVSNVEPEPQEEKTQAAPIIEEGNSAQNEIQLSTIEIQIYPNPTTHKFTIKCDEELSNCTLLLTDLNGTLLQMRPFEGLQTSVDLSEYPKGSYIISIIQDENLIKSEVVIKQ